MKCSSEWCDWQYTYASSVARMVDNASNQGKLIPLFPISVSMSLSKYWCNTNASSVSNLAISNQRLSFDKNRQSSLYTVGKNPGILKALETFLKKVHKIQSLFFERFPKMIALFATRRKWQPFLKGNCQRFLVLIESETWKWHPNKLFCGNSFEGLTKRWGFEVYSIPLYPQQ